MKIAHISDIHFFSPSFHPLDILSNKWIGNLNAHLRRKNFFITRYLDQFLASLIKEGTDMLIITGDFTTTADKKEFLLAKEFIQKVLDANIKVYALPGNHDMYTRKSFKEKIFFSILDILPTFSNDSLHFEKIHPFWDLVLLDNTILNNPFKANGRFSKDHQEKLEACLKNASNIIVANHFPLEDKKESHKLLGGEVLKQTLKNHSHPIIYLHGHTHKTSYHKETDKLHVFNSSEVTVNHKFKYQQISLDDGTFTHKEIQYFD